MFLVACIQCVAGVQPRPRQPFVFELPCSEHAAKENYFKFHEYCFFVVFVNVGGIEFSFFTFMTGDRQKKQFFIAFFDDADKLLNSTKSCFIITFDLESVSKFDIPTSFGALNRSHSEEVCPFHSGSGCNVKINGFRWKNTGQMHPRSSTYG